MRRCYKHVAPLGLKNLDGRLGKPPKSPLSGGKTLHRSGGIQTDLHRNERTLLTLHVLRTILHHDRSTN